MTRFNPSINSKILELFSAICILATHNHHASYHSQYYYFQHAHSRHQLTQPFHSEVCNSPNETICSINCLFRPQVSPKCTAYTVKTFNKSLSKTIFSISTLSLCLSALTILSTHFSDTNIPTPSDLSLPTSQNSLYLSPLAPKNLQPLTLHHVSWMLITSTSLSANASISSPALPITESTFQVLTRNSQPLSSWSQPTALAQTCASLWLGFPTSSLCRHVEAPTGWYPTIIRSSPQKWPNKPGKNVCPYVRPSVHPQSNSMQPQTK